MPSNRMRITVHGSLLAQSKGLAGGNNNDGYCVEFFHLISFFNLKEIRNSLNPLMKYSLSGNDNLAKFV
ncbi:hypothetical protein CLV98_101423 [Dyadobacter jejuensis]|uniref:Uncharacterized protein n=1 Tax=Dyadobacter jejuensis TaxID=1082580 RepID=A0A316ARM9_9BACT|nr:hypothetical protein CLV98_101423 [Dyadobacter jejuensis]